MLAGSASRSEPSASEAGQEAARRSGDEEQRLLHFLMRSLYRVHIDWVDVSLPLFAQQRLLHVSVGGPADCEWNSRKTSAAIHASSAPTTDHLWQTIAHRCAHTAFPPNNLGRVRTHTSDPQDKTLDMHNCFCVLHALRGRRNTSAPHTKSHQAAGRDSHLPA
jgi:hypothetical protein